MKRNQGLLIIFNLPLHTVLVKEWTEEKIKGNSESAVNHFFFLNCKSKSNGFQYCIFLKGQKIFPVSSTGSYVKAKYFTFNIKHFVVIKFLP